MNYNKIHLFTCACLYVTFSEYFWQDSSSLKLLWRKITLLRFINSSLLVVSCPCFLFNFLLKRLATFLWICTRASKRIIFLEFFSDNFFFLFSRISLFHHTPRKTFWGWIYPGKVIGVPSETRQGPSIASYYLALLKSDHSNAKKHMCWSALPGALVMLHLLITLGDETNPMHPSF